MDRWNTQANSIFARAIEIESIDRRSAFIERACRGDDEVRAEVERLLRAHNTAGNFLNETIRDVATIAAPTEIEQTVSCYRLLEQIGEGGFADVYRAEQTEPVRREVAVKITKPGMDTRAVIARFEAERQALAMMDHPNIAHVLDAGATESGRPYFVMEVVHGLPITQYCNAARRGSAGPVELADRRSHEARTQIPKDPNTQIPKHPRKRGARIHPIGIRGPDHP